MQAPAIQATGNPYPRSLPPSGNASGGKVAALPGGKRVAGREEVDEGETPKNYGS